MKYRRIVSIFKIMEKTWIMNDLESSDRRRWKWRKCWEYWKCDILPIMMVSADGLWENVHDMVVENTSKWFKLTSFQPQCVDKNRHSKFSNPWMWLNQRNSQHSPFPFLHQPKVKVYQIFFGKWILHLFLVWVNALCLGHQTLSLGARKCFTSKKRKIAILLLD